MKISDIVDRHLVNTHLRARNREGVLSEIVEALGKRRAVKDRQAVLQALLEREARGSTGLGSGLAIPHARIENLKNPVLYVGLSRHGIHFSSADGKPVHVVVLFLTPIADPSAHLKILSKIASFFSDPLIAGEVRSAVTNEELFYILKQGDFEIEGFTALTREQIYLELNTDENGISEQESRKRLEEYGPNRLKAIRKKPLIVRFARNFMDLLALLMWIGSGLSFWAKMPEAGWACIVVILVNAVFSFSQEFKAEKAIESLKRLIPSYARVIRRGEEKKVLTQDIVPGDVIILEEGDHVCADARLIDAQEFRVNNSTFSGESKLSHKMAEGFQAGRDFLWLEMPNLVFAGTSVASGFGKAVVIATGMSTEIGKIAYLTQSVKEDLSPLQREVNRISKMIAMIAVAMGFIFFFVGYSLTKMTVTAAGMFAIGIILANVPQGLMPTLTLALAMAVQRMAQKHALIKKLSSIETLGCTNVICTDKTGTLTTNEMSVKKIWVNDKVVDVSGSGYDPAGTLDIAGKSISTEDLRKEGADVLMRIGVLCNTARLVAPSETQNYWSIIGDPTEGALLTLARKGGIDYEAERLRHPVEKRFPFESIRKRMSSVNRVSRDCRGVFVKGAAKELLELSKHIAFAGTRVELTESKKADILAALDLFAREGLRVLGFAYRDIGLQDLSGMTAQDAEKDLVFIGATAMYDPPRPEVKEAVAVCKKAGIRVAMITGDYQLTALSIARQVGIVASEKTRVITGADFAQLTDEQIKDAVSSEEVVFARVNPEHKLRVVNIFKDMGHIVAVTGDGVNDAPALKRADIGVAMGLRGTDVAREAAEMILTDDNFASIVSAIEEGRAVFENIKKFITYIFAHLVPEAVPFIFYALLKIPVPITTMQILAIDLGTETLPALALGIEKPEPGIMELPPRPKKKGIIDKIVLFRGYVFLGLLNSIAVLVAYFAVLYSGGWRPGVPLESTETSFTNPLHLKAMTVIFVGIVVMQVANIFACRSEKYSVFRIGFFDNRLILLGIVFELIFAAGIIYLPFFQRIFNTIGLGWKEWAMLFVFMGMIFFAEEARKRFFPFGAVRVNGRRR